jgi:hypothetical protein
MSEKWAALYLYVRGIDFASLYDFCIGFWSWIEPYEEYFQQYVQSTFALHDIK